MLIQALIKIYYNSLSRMEGRLLREFQNSASIRRTHAVFLLICDINSKLLASFVFFL